MRLETAEQKIAMAKSRYRKVVGLRGLSSSLGRMLGARLSLAFAGLARGTEATKGKVTEKSIL